MEELATMIEQAWMEWNSAQINRLHPERSKTQLSNILINNCKDIIAALRNYHPETSTVITGDMEPPRKVRKKGD